MNAYYITSDKCKNRLGQNGHVQMRLDNPSILCHKKVLVWLGIKCFGIKSLIIEPIIYALRLQTTSRFKIQPSFIAHVHMGGSTLTHTHTHTHTIL